MTDPKKLAEMTLDDLTTELGLPPSSHRNYRAIAELRRREMVAGMEALQAQKDAATAAAETAAHTRRSANYILWSVIAIAAASVVNALVVLFGR